VSKGGTRPSENPYRRSLLRRQQSLDTRARIIRGAARVWAEKGFDDGSIEDICAAAEIGRSTFYFHFASKDEVLGALRWATASGTAAEVERALEAGGLREQLEAFVDAVSRRIESTPKELVAVVLRRGISAMEQRGGQPDESVDFGQILARILEHAQPDGSVPADVDAKELGAILGGMVMEALLRWATGQTGTTALRDSLWLRFDLVLRGLTA